jgi:glycosyltransferase involved in cell wall biosynthesis
MSKNTKKLIYLHQYFNLPTNPGGTRSWELSRRLVRDGWHVVMVTRRKPQSTLDAWQQYLEKELADCSGRFELRLVGAAYGNEMSFKRRILAFLQFALKSSWVVLKERDVSLVFATSTPLTIALPAILRKWIWGTKFVFEVRDLWPEMPIAVGALKSPIARGLARFLERLTYSQASQVIGLSPGMCEGIVSAGKPARLVHEVPNSSDLDRFDVPASLGEEFRAQHPEIGDRPLVTYAGTFGLVNKVGYLVRVASEMKRIAPEVCFLTVGGGAEFESVKLLAQELGVWEENYFQWPSLKKEQMPALFSAADVSAVLFAPIKEMEKNSSNKFFDSLAAGRPVALNYGGWMKDLVEASGAGVYLDAFDHKVAAHSLAELLSDPARLKSSSEAAQQLARQKFDRELLYRKLREVLDSELSGDEHADFVAEGQETSCP